MEALTFIHVPRTGGMSVGECLFGGRVDHQKVSECARPGQWRFAFVREPADRFLSAFNWIKNGHGDRYGFGDVRERIGGRTAGEFLDDDEVIRKEGLFDPMSQWLDGPVHFVGRFEKLAEGVRYVQQCMGMVLTELPHLNGSSGSEKLSADALRKIKARYAEDYHRFGYEA